MSKIPLADRMRPETFEDFLGQEEVVGVGRLLRLAIESDNLPSMIFLQLLPNVLIYEISISI